MEHDPRRDAVDRAYRDHADDVYRVVYAVVRDVEQARDVTHDSFARAFERWHQYDDQRPLRPWLQGIAVHGALDAVRRRRLRAFVPPIRDRDGSAPTDREPSTADQTERTSQRDALDTAMATLRPAARAALVLRHVYGYEYAEIGRMLGTSAGNVGSLLSRAHVDLRARLSADFRPSVSSADAPQRAAR